MPLNQRIQPGTGYWGTGIDLRTRRANPDKAKAHHQKRDKPDKVDKPDKSAKSRDKDK